VRKIINFKAILLIISLFLITSCSNNSAMKPEDFKDKEPREFFKIDLVKLQDSSQQI
jgi:hypothetical protein